jgi:hypothetical protein
VRFTPVEDEATAVESSPPKGVALTALAMGALAVPAAATVAAQFHTHSLLGFGYGGLALAVAWYTVWSYWKGYHWARVVVLIASFVIVTGETSKIFDRDANLIELMSHPVLFLRFALAAFLLYWLNTRPLRIWFKNAPTAADLISQSLEGRLCTAVERSGAAPNDAWRLAFEHDAELTLNCPWRIVLDDNLAFASHSSSTTQAPATEAPLTAPSTEAPINAQQPSQLLENLRVKAVRLAPRTSDLFISFEMGIELQSWSTDPPIPNAQQWKFSDPALVVIADSVGVKPQAVAPRIPAEGADENG